VGIIAFVVITVAVLIGVGWKFYQSDWDSYEVAKKSLEKLQNAKGYIVERTVNIQMRSPYNETLRDSVLEKFRIRVGENGVIQMDYIDAKILDGEEKELGAATFYFDKDKIYSDESSQNYYWKAEEIQENGNMVEETLSSFVKKLDQVNQEYSEAKIKKEEKDGQYIITVTYHAPVTGEEETSYSLYVDRFTKNPVKMKIVDKTNGFETNETIQWKDINKVGKISIPGNLEVIEND
jgi:hypothetical protein